MSEVLRVISQSKVELQSILEDIAKTAAQLCRSDGAAIFHLENGVYRFAAGYSLSPAYAEIERQSVITPGPGTIIGRAALTRKVVRIDDVSTDPLYKKKEDAKVEGNRSFIGVPLMRDGQPIVVIGLGRHRVEPFGEREIELAKTFATQAVIAIENARLLKELRQRTADLSQRTADLTESLERQNATSEVLHVISAFSGDLEPVFRLSWSKQSVFAMPSSAPFFFMITARSA
jgi:GAF domain-containing protein